MSATLSTTIIVLKKTKLGETDLIINGFGEDGKHLRAVAKGARKPGSKLGVHLELYSSAKVLVSVRSRLGIISEAHTVDSHLGCRSDVLHSAAAGCIVELLDKVSDLSEADPRLFHLTNEALRCLGEAPDCAVRLIAAATILKIASQIGMRPSLERCVSCSTNDLIGQGTAGDEQISAVRFSFIHGGVVCLSCAAQLADESYTALNFKQIQWAIFLISSKYSQIEQKFLGFDTDEKAEHLGQSMLEFSRTWTYCHLVNRLKSLEFLVNFS